MGVGYSSSALYGTRNLGREVELSINGKQHNVSDNVPADTTLNAYIREHAHLKGTKFMCLEGGCGACIVSVTTLHPATGKHITQAVNSCLVPIFACHGWEVTTIEGLGNKKAGYNKIVKRLAAANGTQCGYCSPAMVMNMYSLLESNPKITMKEVENSFGGNICRCTGYRPILDAFKSFASDAPNELVSKLADIEDMICPSKGQLCTNDDFCFLSCPNKIFSPSIQGLHFQLEGGASWFRPANKQEIFEILDMIGEKSYRFIAGNTGHGVYRIKEEPVVYIDIKGVRELHGAEVTSDGLTLGANIGLTEAMQLFYRLARENPNMFTYCKTLADHIDLVANVPVRNIGTLAGNLSMKHQYKEFPSDIFLFLEMVGAEISIADSTGEMQRMKLLEYLETDMNRKIIVKILLPMLNNDWYIVKSYKIMPRAQNAHAYVNAGFMIKVDKKSFTVQEKPNIIFGGIRPECVHAVKTEEYLKGKNLLSEITLKGALEVLDSELEPDHVLPDACPVFRKGLALSLFYKFILSIAPDRVNEKYRSGGSLYDRPVSSAKQDFQTNSSLWPLNKPIPKVEALIQCAGEAEYVNDIPYIPGQLWGQLILSDRGGAVVAKIDPSEALKMKGVVAFFSSEDIPGKNSFYPPGMFLVDDEQIFSNGRTSYAGEAVGVIIAESHTLALKAAKRVKVEYSDERKLVTNMREIISKNMTERIKETWRKIEPKKQGSDIKYKINGQFEVGTQYHYTMETLSCLAVPTEDHLVVYPTTQWPSFVQEAISIALKIPENMIDVRVRRLGGAYGAKVTRATHTAVVSCLAAHLLQRPVRLVLNMETNMEWAGKRYPVYSDYEVGVNDEGVVQYMTTRLYQDSGFADNDSAIFLTLEHLPNCYDSSAWDVKGYSVKTDSATNSWCRAPASTEALCLIETIMEHVANVTGKDPMEVRYKNLDPEDKVILPFCEEMKKISDYDKRLKEIDQYNKTNRWKKRGLSLVPMNFPIFYYGCFHATVSIFQMDGSVSVIHGGVEMGQGLNTKAVQVAAKTLDIDIWQVTVKPVMTAVHPNNGSSGGSIASESVCYAVMKCCEELNERLAPIKKELGSKATWAEICTAASLKEVNLSSTYMEKASELKPYSVYGAAVTEVEVDILTGQYHTVRVDILEDAGESLSPEVDIGQIEGAFVMGLGYYTCEEIVYQADTGRLLTNRTWNYKPPGVKDIPLDFRVTLQKNVSNPLGVLRSKATGEPPFCLSCSVIFAIRNAVESARKDTGIKQELWFDFEQPYTVEKIWLGTLTKKEMFKL